jgi:hypothetical protein
MSLVALIAGIHLYQSIKIIKENDYENKRIDILIIATIINLSLANIFLNLIGVYNASDILGIICVPSIFATSYLFTKKTRITYLLIYYIVSMTLIAFLSNNLLIYIDRAITLFCCLFLFYLVGNFVYDIWEINIFQSFEKEDIIEKLAQKNKQQQQTFDALSKAFQEFDTTNPDKITINNQGNNIKVEEKTLELLKEFTNTQKLFKQTLEK